MGMDVAMAEVRSISQLVEDAKQLRKEAAHQKKQEEDELCAKAREDEEKRAHQQKQVAKKQAKEKALKNAARFLKTMK
eukprot:m.243555 g.243555  ORF g.243555 m.243555 type:complete len:78 (+) comp45357_c0_seq1:132-365(+)